MNKRNNKMEIINVNNISKTFGEKPNQLEVLKNNSFSINKGEFVSIMGPSGSGKSTLLYIIGGLDLPTSGEILINGVNINSLGDKEKSKIRIEKIGFIFQFYNLVQNLTVEENIFLPLAMKGKRIKHYKKEIDEILEIVGLTDKRKVVPSKLSGGQQQRVAIARAVINNPDIILADEPIGNLDSVTGTEIMKLFKRINLEKGITILQVTHSENSASYSTRIIRMKDGRIDRDDIVL